MQQSWCYIHSSHCQGYNSDEQYTAEQLISLYEYDDALRNLCFQHLSYIEISLQTIFLQEGLSTIEEIKNTSFGSLSKQYASLPLSQRKTIAHYYHKDEKVLTNRFKTLVLVRNICCHHGQLYPLRLLSKVIIPKYDKDIFQGDQTSIFCVFAMITYLSHQIEKGGLFVAGLKSLFQSHPVCEKTIQGTTSDQRIQRLDSFSTL